MSGIVLKVNKGLAEDDKAKTAGGASYKDQKEI